MTARDNREQIPDPRRLVALLADPARLRVFAALVLAANRGASPRELARASGVPVRDVVKALIRLDEARLAARLTPQRSSGGEPGGVAEPARGEDEAEAEAADRWRAVPETMRAATDANVRKADTALPAQPVVQDPGTASLLRGFFAQGRLTHVPAAHGKRMVVLDYLAQCFEPGVRYEEAKVNRILGDFHDDYAALRRYLVDAGFLSRSENMYWRSGGSVGL
ncbi:DUF2087 domain-containing protein [Actinocrinis puniceicyclus]|uniref:DUF2087 domain-containing protein n=1 Tax=Actinocrinis puniceicyclus TaxID=977794 RepID=A0A8J8BCT6_9ACTN|nr:DUF2087 domain-containing protein [Actinocrinis puniceicyclus]MBS2963850.1 DUF2087 domain-containing protein [Actinocrinis puniceicyclus]